MRGHTQLIDLRLRKVVPNIVFLNDWRCKVDWFDVPDSAVTISTDGDDVHSLDLRFLVGLAVSVSSQQEDRAKALFERCKQAGAKVVAACHVQADKPHWKQSGWCDVWRKGGV